MYEMVVCTDGSFFSDYRTNVPQYVATGAVGVIMLITVLFFVYDYFVRRAFGEKNQLLESKRRFVRFVSHEVRTPLNSACLGLSLVLEEIADFLGYSSADEMKKSRAFGTASNGTEAERNAIEWFTLVTDILNSAKSAVSVLNDLLNYDNIEMKTLDLDLTVFSLWKLAELTASEFKVSSSQKNITLATSFDVFSLDDGTDTQEEMPVITVADDLPSSIAKRVCVGDDVRLRQVLRNLLSNAIKFTSESGSITVRVSLIDGPMEAEERIVRFDLKNGDSSELSPSGEIQIEVIDTGAGMSPQQIETVFNDGIQFNVNELQAGQGSGLGLYIAKGIVEQHSGTLSASSEGLGKGTTFRMTMPLYSVPESMQGDAAYASDADSVHQEPVDSSLRVLVVDDVQSNRKLLSRLLQRHGHKCDIAEDGKVAVEMVAESMKSDEPYHTVLMDYEMPVMKGPQAAQQMRQLGFDSFIVGLTGNMLPDDVAHYKACGANAVLPKPFKMASLDDLWAEQDEMS